MKVLLVNPPRYNELIGNNPEIIEEERGHNPPLGLLYLAGYLEKYSDHEVAVLDAQAEELTYEQLEQSLAQKQADVVGIEAMTFTLIDVIKTVQLVKKVSPETKVVLGGPHVHIYPEETINLPGVDFLVLGEGERSFHYLLDHLHKPDQLKEMRGFVFKENGNIINTGISDSIYDLDNLPFPARHLTDITRYSSLLAKRDIVTTMFTSRGCPYRCTFCDRPFSPVIGREFRYRSAKNVVDEMETCTHMGIYEFLIYDDTFSVRKDRVMAMCEEIIRRKLKVGWDVRAHVNTVTPDLLKAMKKAGCERIHYGVEAGNDRMLKLIKKNSTVARIKDAFKWTREAGMETLAYFIIGQQTETRKDIQDSMRLAREIDPNYVHITILCPYPATEIYLEGLKTGILKKDVWKEYARNPTPDFQPPFWEEIFTAQELQEMLVEFYKNFYMRPGYIIKNILRIRSLGEFKRKIKAGCKVIGMSSH
jgi:radical SAM superfamily enzyme YgiQ (UPF0313 family)